MSSIQFQEDFRELQQLKNQTFRNIDEMKRLQGEERLKKIREIENNISTINSLIQSINEYMPMMEPTERNKITKTLQDYHVEARRLEDLFKDAKNRGELMGTPKIVLEGGSNAQRQGLLNQRSMIEKGNNDLMALADMAEDADQIGQGALNELDLQKEKEIAIGNKLDDLDFHSKIGERTVDRMLCRTKQRTAILWIVIVIVIMVFLGVFLYFVFKP